MAAKLTAPKRRAYGHGSVSIQGLSYVVTFKNLATGKTSRRSFATDAEAQVFLDGWYAEKTAKELADSKRAAGPNPRKLPPAARTVPGTFQDLTDRWRDARAGDFDPGTWRSYDGARRGLNRWLGDIKLDRLVVEDFRHYRTARQKGIDWNETGAAQKVATIKPITINKHIDVANQIFEWGIKEGLVDYNPVSHLARQKLKVEEWEPAVATSDQIDALIDAAAPKYRLEFLLYGHLAMRWGEGVGLRLVDVVGNEIRVRKEVTEDREGSRRRERAGPSAERSAADKTALKLADVKTKGSKRELIASSRILDAIERARHAIRGKPNPHRVLRPTSTGQLYREGNWLRDAWAPALKRAGLEDLTNDEGDRLSPHGLRHSRLSIMAASGRISEVHLSKFAGHEDVSFTMRKYGSHFRSSRIKPEDYLATGPRESAERPKRSSKKKNG